VNRRPRDPNSVPTIAERRRLLEVHRAATRFFRRELLRATDGWAGEYLVRGGASELLASNSGWAVGYAPDARSRLVDHLRARGFELASVRNAGLGLLNPEGRTVDRFRDQVMFPTRNDRLETVGFVGARNAEAPYYATSPATQVHRRSNSLVGVAEQLDLLSEGAVPVLVNDPLDAVAIERVSRLTIGGWAGIPLCDSLLSAEQARILGRYAATDAAIVVLADDKAGQRAAVGFLDDLSRFFRRVRAVELPANHSPSRLSISNGGLQRLHDALLITRPLSDYRPARKRRRPSAPGPAVDLSPSGETPSL
jgi:DNA primase